MHLLAWSLAGSVPDAAIACGRAEAVRFQALRRYFFSLV
jgi:hypothetical protein